MADIIHEHTAHVRTPEGQGFVVRTRGERREDGTWIGWLEFEPLDGRGARLSTERETTQSSREALTDWALGLEAVYLEGAFERAHLVSGR